MVDATDQIGLLLCEYDQDWLRRIANVESRLRLLHVLKQGIELLLLVGSYLIFYFIECFVEVLSMPLPLVR